METLLAPDQVNIHDSSNVLIGNHLTANGDIVIEDRRVTNVFFNQRFSELRKKIDQLELTLAHVPDTEATRTFRLDTAKQLSEEKEKERAFVSQILELAETLSKVEVNTDRLRQAKAYFEQGQFQKANEILNQKDLDDEQEKLLAVRTRLEKERRETNLQLKNNATEFLIKAQIVSIDFSNCNRLKDSLSAYESSIQSFSFFENNFRFANFLQDNHVQSERIEALYLAALQDPEIQIESKAAVYKNLGLYYLDKRQFKQVKVYFKKAIKIRRQLAADEQPANLRQLADCLDNMGCFYKNRYNFERALGHFNEALAILQGYQFADENKARQAKAIVLNNLGSLYQELEDFELALRYYQSALQEYDQLVKKDPETYQCDQAFIQVNLGSLHYELEDTSAALKAYHFALDIYQRLMRKNPYAYTEDLGILNIYLGMLYCVQRPDQQLSMSYTQEGLRLLRPLLPDWPWLQEYYQRGEAILDAWASASVKC